MLRFVFLLMACMLEWAHAISRRCCPRRRPQVSGIRFSFDVDQPAGSRVAPGSVEVAGEPLDLNRKYKASSTLWSCWLQLMVHALDAGWCLPCQSPGWNILL